MRVIAHLADHFETLANGKPLAVGLYPDRVIVLNVPPDTAAPSADMPYGSDMGLMVTLCGLAAGKHEGHIAVLPPGLHDRPVASIKFGCEVMRPGSSVNITTNLRPLLTPALGTYIVEAKVGEDVGTDTFEVHMTIDPNAPAPGTARLVAPSGSA